MASPVWYSQAPKANALFKMPGPSVFNANNDNLLRYINFVVDVGDQLAIAPRSPTSDTFVILKFICLYKLGNNIAFFLKSHYFTVRGKETVECRELLSNG